MHLTPNVFDLVLLHSGAGEARDWRRMIGELGAGFRCAALDFYGCGRTPAWSGPHAMTIDDQVELVAEAVRHPVHLCGHSYGGAVALRFATRHPELVESVTVIEPQCYLLLRETGDVEFEVSLGLWNRVRGLFECGEPEAAWRHFVDYFSGEGFWARLKPEIREGFVKVSPVERWAVLFGIASRKLGEVQLRIVLDDEATRVLGSEAFHIDIPADQLALVRASLERIIALV